MPDLRWDDDRARTLGGHALDLWMELLQRLPSLPVARKWKELDVAKSLGLAVPEKPASMDAIKRHLREVVFDYSMYPGHPRFMAFITGAGTIPGAVADLVAAAINQNVGGYRLAPAATEIEQFLGRWFGEQFGLPKGCGGIMASGGAMANFIALKAMRDAKCGFRVREQGVAAGPPLAIYASSEVHDVVTRGADMLGLGSECVRKIPVDSQFRMRPEALVDRLHHDLQTNVRPIGVVGTAGTVSTGAIDPLDAIADVCKQHELWFHVDGAYGALAVLADDLRPQFEGLERADSIAFDPHKWLYVPHSAGFVVLRELQKLEAAFGLHPSYVKEDKQRTGHGVDQHVLGPQFSRGFSAFKVWLSLLAHGKEAYGKRISHDAALARYMAARAAEHPDLEVMAPVPLSICCFRYVPRDGVPEGGKREPYLDRLNERLMTELQLDGRAYCSNAVVNDRFVLRACIVNFRTEAADVDALLDVARELGARLHRELASA
jgi:aromatic-L-amino-acid decarboxylase